MSLVEIVLVSAAGIAAAAGVCLVVVRLAVRHAHKEAPPVRGALDE